jgi:hypothetical protein
VVPGKLECGGLYENTLIYQHNIGPEYTDFIFDGIIIFLDLPGAEQPFPGFCDNVQGFHTDVIKFINNFNKASLPAQCPEQASCITAPP